MLGVVAVRLLDVIQGGVALREVRVGDGRGITAVIRGLVLHRLVDQ